MLMAVSKEVYAERRNRHAMLFARRAKDLIADGYVRDIYPWPAANQQNRHMSATHAMTGDTVSKTGISILPSMRMQQPVEDDPKAGRESV